MATFLASSSSRSLASVVLALLCIGDIFLSKPFKARLAFLDRFFEIETLRFRSAERLA
jgi:hypothetical protein